MWLIIFTISCYMKFYFFFFYFAKKQATVGRLSAYRAKWEDYILRFENTRYLLTISERLP